MKTDDIREMTHVELDQRLVELKGELFNLRFN